MRLNLILHVVAKFVIPLIILFALYVQFHGDFGPGGGFQAGVIFAAAIILYALLFGLDNTLEVLPPGVLPGQGSSTANRNRCSSSHRIVRTMSPGIGFQV